MGCYGMLWDAIIKLLEVILTILSNFIQPLFYVLNCYKLSRKYRGLTIIYNTFKYSQSNDFTLRNYGTEKKLCCFINKK